MDQSVTKNFESETRSLKSNLKTYGWKCCKLKNQTEKKTNYIEV
jgi:hypothetical protein